MTVREKLEIEMDKEEIERWEEKMLTVKNLIKIPILITATVLIQLEVISEKGRWVAGGNLAFPVLLLIILWWPSYFKKWK